MKLLRLLFMRRPRLVERRAIALPTASRNTAPFRVVFRRRFPEFLRFESFWRGGGRRV